MASSAVDICNRALLRVGHRQRIGDLNEDTAEAQACNALYAMNRDEVLAAFPWGFATARLALGLRALTNTSWAYVYALPSDCITVRYVSPGSFAGAVGDCRFEDVRFAPSREGRVPFRLEYDSTTEATILVTEQESAELVYTARITTELRFPPLFVDALCWKLASDLALSLPVKPQVGLAMEQKYKDALGQAAAADANQGQGDVAPDAEHIRVR